jgi:hypothetical protein
MALIGFLLTRSIRNWKALLCQHRTPGERRANKQDQDCWKAKHELAAHQDFVVTSNLFLSTTTINR